MANSRWRPQLTRQERVRGMIFFVLYFLVFPFLKMGVEWVFDHFFQLYLSEAVSAAVYYYIMAVLTMVVFWGFLKNGGRILRDFLPENLLALVTGLAGGLLLWYLFRLLPWPLANPDHTSWAEQYRYSPAATILIVVVLMPVIEEVLFRGLLFGTLRRYSRFMAWIASVALFMIYSVWTFAVAYGKPGYLVLSFQYLPAALALTWCYDRGGSIWTPAVLHMILNGVALASVV